MNFLIIDPLSTFTEVSDLDVPEGFTCDDHSSNCAIFCGEVTCVSWSCSVYKCGDVAVDTFD